MISLWTNPPSLTQYMLCDVDAGYCLQVPMQRAICPATRGLESAPPLLRPDSANALNVAKYFIDPMLFSIIGERSMQLLLVGLDGLDVTGRDFLFGCQ